MLIRGCRLKNFGDNLNVDLIKLISGEISTIVNNSFTNPNNETIYMAIGSVLGWATKDTIIWGTGKMSTTDATMFKEKPKKICAVRGPLTREEIIKRGFECPAIFGDPALLMPYFYRPEITVEHEIGFIPHHIDKVMIPELKKQFPEAHFIDIQSDTFDFIREVLKCKTIITSSLHGQIIADAYNTPNAWIKLSEKVLGHGFKMRDYYASVKRIDQEPSIWSKELKTNSLQAKIEGWNSADIDLEPLWNACPFKRRENECIKFI